MNALVLRNASTVAVELLPAAVHERDVYIAAAKSITRIATAQQQQEAVTAVANLRKLTKAVESGRTSAKAPVLDIGRKIDAMAKDFTRPAEVEAERVLKLVNEYQAEQARIAAEAERKRQDEIRRAEEAQLKAEAELRAKQEELERIQREKERADREADATALEIARKAELDARHAMLMQRMNAAKADAQGTRAASVVVAGPVKAAGTMERKEPRFEVLDVVALASSRLDLVTIEPKRADILAQIRNGMTECAGLRIWWETTTTVRTS